MIGKPGANGIDFRFALPDQRGIVLERGTYAQIAILKLLGAVEGAPALIEQRLGGPKFCLGLFVVELDQPLTGLDAVAVLEVDGTDGAGERRGKGNALVRLQGAQSFDRVLPDRGVDGGADHCDWCITLRLSEYRAGMDRAEQ